VDRHRSRRHADFGGSAAPSPDVAHLDQPLRRGHDALRRHVRRGLSGVPPRPPVAPVLALPLPPHPGKGARTSQPPPLPRLSPPPFDVSAVSPYVTVSALFWFIGLVPDMATLRDRAESRMAQRVYGILALGWRGSGRHWHHYETAYNLLAGLAAPLVVSVHTIVSFDFAVAQLPGWHATVFPQNFVAGALYTGFSMVIILAITHLGVFYVHGHS